jgi:hypothetical protein
MSPSATERPALEDEDASISFSQARRERLRQEGQKGRTPFVPLLIFFAAAVAWSAFQFYQLQLESATLATLRANQDPQLQQAQRVRSTLDTMALETQKLADAGNPNARLVVEELGKRGITIKRTATDPGK